MRERRVVREIVMIVMTSLLLLYSMIMLSRNASTSLNKDDLIYVKIQIAIPVGVTAGFPYTVSNWRIITLG